jgi:short-subunit dehydrogenase
MSEPRRIFLTGASTGIGAALAVEYAAPGVTLGLVARRAEILAEVLAKAEARGARVLAYPVDVTDREAMERVAASFVADAGGADLVIANAGIGWHTRKSSIENTREVARVAETNLVGVVHTLCPFIAPMRAARAGHLVATGSVAGFAGLPVGTYSASKAGVRTFMDTLRVYLGGEGIAVTTLCPGFVDTPIVADNPYPMPFLISAEKAAKLVRKGLRAGKKTYVFPWIWRLVIPLMKLAPAWLLRWGARRRA